MILGGILFVVMIVLIIVVKKLNSPVADSLELLESTKAAVLAYAKETGEPPENLEAVVAAGQLKELPLDRSGNPVIYTLNEDRTAELKVLGSDGEEGGQLFKRDQSIQFQFP